MPKKHDIPPWAWLVIAVGLAWPLTKLVMSRLESARVMKLSPDVRRVYLDFIAAANQEGLRIFTGRTQGSVSQTARHRAAGRSSVNVSWHDLKPPRAIDIKVGPMGGRIVARPRTDAHERLYLQALRIAERYGFRQIGFYDDDRKRYLRSGAWDPYHIEYRGPFANINAAIEATGVIA